MARPPPPALFTLRILWGALLVASLGLPVVGLFARAPNAKPMAFLPLILGVVSVVELGLSHFWVAQLLRVALSNRKFEVTEVPDPDAIAGFYRERAPTVKVFANPDAVERSVYAAFQTPFILKLALREAIAMYGVVLGVLGHPIEQFLPFGALAAIAIAVELPTHHRVIALVERVYGARMPKPQPG